MSATKVTEVYCIRCPRIGLAGEDLKKQGWTLRPDHPVIVQGKCIAKCPGCSVGLLDTSPKETSECGGSCDGNYRPEQGGYYMASQDTEHSEESWACWDLECVKGWAAENTGDCPTCGTFDAVGTVIDRYSNGRWVARL